MLNRSREFNYLSKVNTNARDIKNKDHPILYDKVGRDFKDSHKAEEKEKENSRKLN